MCFTFSIPFLIWKNCNSSACTINHSLYFSKCFTLIPALRMGHTWMGVNCKSKCLLDQSSVLKCIDTKGKMFKFYPNCKVIQLELNIFYTSLLQQNLKYKCTVSIVHVTLHICCIFEKHRATVSIPPKELSFNKHFHLLKNRTVSWSLTSSPF